MARTTKLVAWANVSLLRAATRHGTRRHQYTTQTAVVALSESNHDEQASEEDVEYKNKQGCKVKVMEMNWVPHPRTGIYIPEGQDWVMDDVPCNAATLGQGQTYWLRNVDGVEKHDPDVSSADQYLLNDPHRG